MKIKKILFIIAVLLSFTTLAGCFEVNQVQSIEFKTQPKLVYEVNDELDVTIVVTMTDGTVTEYNTIENATSLTIKGFNTNTPTLEDQYRTFVISFGGSSISAMYRVVEDSEDPYINYFAGKDGEYYLIETAQQLSNIRYALNQKFRLEEDIDLTGIKWRPIGNVEYSDFVPNKTVAIEITEAFSGELDGNGKTISNLTAKDADSSSWFVDPTFNFQSIALFVATEGVKPTDPSDRTQYTAVIKNLTVNLNVDVSQSVGVSAIAANPKYTLFEDITVTGNVRTGGHASGITGNDDGCYYYQCVNEANLTSIRSLATPHQSGDYVFTYVYIGGISFQHNQSYVAYYVNCANKGQLRHEFPNGVENEVCSSLIGHAFAQVSGEGSGAAYIINFDYSEAPRIEGSLNNIKFEGFNISTQTYTYTGEPNPYKLLVGGPTRLLVNIDGVLASESHYPNGVEVD